MQPATTPRMSKESVIERLIDSGLWSNSKITRCNVVAIRGYYLDSMGARGKNDRGIYDDAFFILSPDCFASFNGNTDPSIYRTGRAMLKAPQKIVYKLGWHGYGRASGHAALRQSSSVIVHRDGGKGNGKSLGGGLFTDKGTSKFWTNLHRGSWRSTSSHGCLTIPPNQWKAFYNLVKLQMAKYDQDRIVCHLIENKL